MAKSYVGIDNAITNFVKPTPPTKIINNETILAQYRIKKLLKFFGKKVESSLQK